MLEEKERKLCILLLLTTQVAQKLIYRKIFSAYNWKQLMISTYMYLEHFPVYPHQMCFVAGNYGPSNLAILNIKTTSKEER